MKTFHLTEDQRERLAKPKLTALQWMVHGETLFRHGERDLADRLQCIPYGTWRMAKTIGMMESINRDLLETVPTEQCKRLLNQTKDSEIRMVPKLTPQEFRMTLTRDEAMECVDLMRTACQSCIMDGEECRQCVRYKMLTALVPLESFDNLYSCPYSTAEWRW